MASSFTLRILVLSTLIGLVLGFILAILALVSKVGRDVVGTLTAVLNPLPAVAILPLATLWFGLTPTAIVFVVTNACIWPIAMNVEMGFKTISLTDRRVAANLELSHARTIFDVMLPASIPHLVTEVKAAWAFGWRTIVAAELVFGAAGGTGGLGWYINDSRFFLQIPEVFAGLIVISTLGIVVEALFAWLERSTIVKWGMAADRA